MTFAIIVLLIAIISVIFIAEKSKIKKVEETKPEEPEKPKKNKARVFDPKEKYFYNDIAQWYNKYNNVFSDIINVITELDLITNNAFTSSKYHYVKPIISANSKNITNTIVNKINNVPELIELKNNAPLQNVLNIYYNVAFCFNKTMMKIQKTKI